MSMIISILGGWLIRVYIIAYSEKLWDNIQSINLSNFLALPRRRKPMQANMSCCSACDAAFPADGAWRLTRFST